MWYVGFCRGTSDKVLGKQKYHRPQHHARQLYNFLCRYAMHMQCGNEIEYYSLNERKFPFISAYCLCHMGPGQVGHSQIVLTEPSPLWQYLSETVIKVMLSVPHRCRLTQWSKSCHSSSSTSQVTKISLLSKRCWNMAKYDLFVELHLSSRTACIFTFHFTWDLWETFNQHNWDILCYHKASGANSFEMWFAY